MLNYNDITVRKYIILDKEPYEVISSRTTKKSRQKASNQAKLKSLITGKVVEKAFHQSDSVEEAEIIRKKVIYLYTNKGEVWFHSEGDPKDRFSLEENVLGDTTKYLKENTTIEAMAFNDEIIGIKLPTKMDLVVKEAPPSIRGNTSQGGNKQVILETGAVIVTPLFINEGDVIKINTETGEYVERTEKA